jgi:hypothetical protein
LEKGSQNKHAFHLAGIIPVAGQALDFEFPWHDSLQPIAKNYLAIERSVIECAYAGCETIWIVCHDDMQPLIKHRLGDYVQDPLWAFRRFDPIPRDKQKLIPIFYVPVHPKDRDKRDCLGWSALYAASAAYNTIRSLSKWVVPDKYYVSFPYGVYQPWTVREHRSKISDAGGFFLSHEGKTVKDGEYLGFTFDADDHKACVKKIRQEGTGEKVPGSDFSNSERLPIEERWSARFFSLDKVFESVKIDGAMTVDTSWYYNIDNWDGLCAYLGSNEQKEVKKPSSNYLNKRFTFEGITLERHDD